MSTQEKVVNPVKVITGKNTRWSYLYVFEPRAVAEGATPKYSVSLIIPKDDDVTIQKIKDAIQAAYNEGQGVLRGTSKVVPPLSAIHNPLRDGDKEKPEDEAYKNSYFVSANSTKAPGILDAAKNPITDPEEVYSGCYGRASITFFPYNSNGNKGIGCGLNNLMLVRKGEPLGGRSSADADFAEYEDDDELFD